MMITNTQGGAMYRIAGDGAVLSVTHRASGDVSVYREGLVWVCKETVWCL